MTKSTQLWGDVLIVLPKEDMGSRRLLFARSGAVAWTDGRAPLLVFLWRLELAPVTSCEPGMLEAS